MGGAAGGGLAATHLINCSYGNKMVLSNRVIWHIPLQPQWLYHQRLPLAVGGAGRWAGQVVVGACSVRGRVPYLPEKMHMDSYVRVPYTFLQWEEGEGRGDLWERGGLSRAGDSPLPLT